MKDTPASTSEKTFISQTVKINQRLDGRKIDEYRTLNINFGADWGSVLVALGETRVIGQVTCELGQPKATRPNEGILFINVELSAMSGVSFDSGRITDLTVQVNRILEKTFKESRCVDLESLCVTAEDRVWVLRLDLNVLNHEGNLTDCCSVAALAALAHFKRPDVSVMEDEVKIHTAAEKELIPTVLHHYPVCVSYCTFNNGETAVADPSAIEERAAEATLVFGINSYREVCCLNLGGGILSGVNLLLQCAQRAAQRAKLLVDEVKRALEEDTKNRDEKKPVGFTECLKLNKFTTLAEDKLAIKLRHFRYQNIEENNLKREPDSDDEMEESKNVVSLGPNTGILNSNQKDVRWVPEETDSEGDASGGDSESEEENLEQQVESALHNVNQRSNQPISKKKNLPPLSRMSLKSENNDSDSEEEQKMVL